MAEERPTTAYILSAAAALAVVAGVLILLSRPRSEPPSAPSLGPDQKAYLSQVVISDTRMSAAENFLGHTVTYLDGQVTNRGNRAVRQLEIQMEFVDTLNQVILRERAFPVNPRKAPLTPGETRPFQVSFDHMPVDWNQAGPTITIESIQF